MAPPLDPAQDPSKSNPRPGPAKPKDYEKVVEELRNVLAGLNKPAPAEPPVETPLPAEKVLPPSPDGKPPAQPTPIFERFGETSLPPSVPERLKEVGLPPALKKETDPPSDAEFWKGNVLGWPMGEPPLAPEPISIKLPPDPTEPSPASRMEKPENEGQDPFGLMSLNQPKGLSGGEMKPPAPPPDTKIPDRDENPLPPPRKRANPFEDFQLPPAPPPPLGVDEPPDLVIENLGMTNNDEIPSLTDPAPPAASAPEAVEQNTSGTSTILPANLRIPIPTTLHGGSPGQTRPPKEDTLQEMDIRPTNVIQVAVLFPEGREGDAKEFLSQLKAAASKAPGTPTVESVLMNPWVASKVDIHSWKKAASISGAHYLYVLVWKKDKDLVKALGKVVHQDEVRARAVVVENIKLRALYADLLVEISRIFDVQG